jgi:hypothetical protein
MRSTTGKGNRNGAGPRAASVLAKDKGVVE